MLGSKGMPLRQIFLISSLIAAPLLACSDTAQTAEQTVCERLLGCDCRQAPYADVAACVAALGDQKTAAAAQADAEGRSYDPACADQLLLQRDSVACMPGDEAAPLLRCRPCHEVHGDGALGASCEDEWDCASDLWCEGGACSATSKDCNEIAVGERCDDEAPAAGVCGQGNFCDTFGTGNCEVPRGPGEPCSTASGCDTLSCVGGICAVTEIGAQCEGFCGDRFVCEQSECAPAPGLGEACVAPVYACSEGLDCWDPADTCQTPQALLCYLYQPEAASARVSAELPAYRAP